MFTELQRQQLPSRKPIAEQERARRDQRRALEHRALQRLSAYTGTGQYQLGTAALAALESAGMGAAVAEGDGKGPSYLWPESRPECIPTKLCMHEVTLLQRDRMLRGIEIGADDLRETHLPLSVLLETYGERRGDSLVAGTTSAQSAGLHSAAADVEGAAVKVPPSSAGAIGGPTAAVAATIEDRPFAAADDDDVQGSATAAPFTPTAASKQQQQQQIDGTEQLQQLAAAEVAVAAAKQQHQIYSIEELQQHAAAAAAAIEAGQPRVDEQLRAIVPDSTRPFTITMRNGKDGRDYVVAHYEPQALQYKRAEKAALLCQIYHWRYREDRMGRVSAPDNERMVMAGMRTDRMGRYGRYAGDEGETKGGRVWKRGEQVGQGKSGQGEKAPGWGIVGGEGWRSGGGMAG